MVVWVPGTGQCCCSYTAPCHSVAHHESKSFRAHWHQWLLVSEHVLINPKSMPTAKGHTSVAHVCLHMQVSACCVSKHSDQHRQMFVHSSHGPQTWTWSPPIMARTRHSSSFSLDSSSCCIRHVLGMVTGICGVGNWAGWCLSLHSLAWRWRDGHALPMARTGRRR